MQSPRLFRKALAVGLMLASPGRALTYWTHSSCDRRIDGVIADTLRMAASASYRIADNGDANQEAAYHLLWQVPLQRSDNDPTYSEVQHVMGGVGSFTRTDCQLCSEVRIYCDNDKTAVDGGRWTVVPDNENDPDPNSKRTLGKNQEWEDKANEVGRTTDALGCLDPNEETLAQTYKILRPAKGSTQNVNRAVITICDVIIEDAFVKSTADVGGEIAEWAEFPTADSWDAVTSVILLHEFTHTAQFRKKDYWLPAPRSTEKGYGWTDVQLLSPAYNLDNADTYALFGLIARVADYKYRLSTIPNELTAGELVYDSAIPDPNPAINRLPTEKRRRRWAKIPSAKMG